jgi:hypothetical protein
VPSFPVVRILERATDAAPKALLDSKAGAGAEDKGTRRPGVLAEL